MVTVVDAVTFLPELARGEALASRDMAAGVGDSRSISDLLVDQVEFADVVLLNKTDLVSERTVATVESVLRRLNPSAQIVHTLRGVVDLATVLGTGLFDPDLAAQSPEWDDEIAGGHTPETEDTASPASRIGRTGRFTRSDCGTSSTTFEGCCAARVSAGSPVDPTSPRSGLRPAPT